MLLTMVFTDIDGFEVGIMHCALGATKAKIAVRMIDSADPARDVGDIAECTIGREWHYHRHGRTGRRLDLLEA